MNYKVVLLMLLIAFVAVEAGVIPNESWYTYYNKKAKVR
jgi:hypothetical protein